MNNIFEGLTISPDVRKISFYRTNEVSKYVSKDGVERLKNAFRDFLSNKELEITEDFADDLVMTRLVFNNGNEYYNRVFRKAYRSEGLIRILVSDLTSNAELSDKVKVYDLPDSVDVIED